jgi:hypothetical protein
VANAAEHGGKLVHPTALGDVVIEDAKDIVRAGAERDDRGTQRSVVAKVNVIESAGSRRRVEIVHAAAVVAAPVHIQAVDVETPVVQRVRARKGRWRDQQDHRYQDESNPHFDFLPPVHGFFRPCYLSLDLTR